MMLIPILALLGVFGQTAGSEDASNPPLQMHVEYPTRFRYKLIDSIRVSLFNTSNQVIPSVNVHFDRAYIDQFSTVTFSPAIKEITETEYVALVRNETASPAQGTVETHDCTCPQHWTGFAEDMPYCALHKPNGRKLEDMGAFPA